MLSVTNLAGQSEPITKYSGYERHEEVNGSLELSFASFFHADNPGHDLIEEESIIEKDGYEFRVKQLSANRVSKQVIALSTFFDLNHVLREDIFAGTKTFDEFATWLFAGTGWAYENVDVVGSMLIPNFGVGNVIALNKILTATFECEYQILPNNLVRFATQIGADNDAQYRYGNNIKALSKKVDTTKLRTRIKGIGAAGLTVTYTSPNSSTFGIRDAGTITDDRYTVAASLTEHIKRQLIDYPEITIELDAIELQQKEIGERVWLIYEPLGIEFQTRVLAKTSRIPEIKSSVIIGNAVPRSLSDILTSTRIDVDENKKQTSSKFEQTNDLINLEVARIDGDIASATSSIAVNADNIALKVSETDYNGDTIAALINLTSTTVTIAAENIDMLGIVMVADTLDIGEHWTDTGMKQIRFRGGVGTARILSPSFSESLIIQAGLDGSVTLDARDRVDLNSDSGGVFANSQRLDTLGSQFASIGHGHTTNTAGLHNHGIPDGTVLQTAGGGTVTFVSSGSHSHST